MSTAALLKVTRTPRRRKIEDKKEKKIEDKEEKKN